MGVENSTTSRYRGSLLGSLPFSFRRGLKNPRALIAGARAVSRERRWGSVGWGGLCGGFGRETEKCVAKVAGPPSKAQRLHLSSDMPRLTAAPPGNALVCFLAQMVGSCSRYGGFAGECPIQRFSASSVAGALLGCKLCQGTRFSCTLRCAPSLSPTPPRHTTHSRRPLLYTVEGITSNTRRVLEMRPLPCFTTEPQICVICFPCQIAVDSLSILSGCTHSHSISSRIVTGAMECWCANDHFPYQMCEIAIFPIKTIETAHSLSK